MPDGCTISSGQVRAVGARRLPALSSTNGDRKQKVEGFSTSWTGVPAVNFDPQRRAASPELKVAIKRLCTFLEQREAALGLRQRRRSASANNGFKLAVEALTCNLGGLLRLGSTPLLAVPRHSGAM